MNVISIIRTASINHFANKKNISIEAELPTEHKMLAENSESKLRGYKKKKNVSYFLFFPEILLSM